MFGKTRRIYEVLAYREPDREPYARETTTRKADALRAARQWASRYVRVEVNALYVAVEDETNIYSDELITAYENGKQTV